MSLAEYQKEVDDSLKPLAKPYWDPLSQLARIVEEVGEAARILNHRYGDKPKKPGEVHAELADELADIIHAVICLANSQDIELDPAMRRAIGKIKGRDKDRFERKAPGRPAS
jgi:NTP pyrophosphatase (non-canonical NTP hydrolase)